MDCSALLADKLSTKPHGKGVRERRGSGGRQQKEMT
jgi:hypothetical protein